MALVLTIGAKAAEKGQGMGEKWTTHVEICGDDAHIMHKCKKTG
jgi:hypothetical protein